MRANKSMKAIGYQHPGAIEREDSLRDITLDKPQPEGRDLLIKVEAVSVNPVDTKVRGSQQPEPGSWRILGYDAAGLVESIGSEVQDFTLGDEVFYAGTINRQGTNSEFHLVDERLVGRKPKSLNYAEAAALPLTSITAWEMLFERLDVIRPCRQGSNCILVIGGGGGVGSITIQLLRALTDLTIIATASRSQTQSWVRQCGAHQVIDHSKPLAEQLDALGLGAPGFVFSTTQSDKHCADIVKLIAPQGRFGLIDDLGDNSIMPFKQKSISIHWEFMFTRSLFNSPDVAEQGRVLNRVAELVDAGKISSTATEVAGKINAKRLRQAHASIESGSTRGKIVLEGF